MNEVSKTLLRGKYKGKAYRAVMPHDILRFLELREDVLREDFAQLYSHLIKRVDAPDDTLNKDLMFIKRDQRSQRRRSQQGEHDACAGPVAREDLALD